MESNGIHEVLAIKPHQTHWNLMRSIDCSNQTPSNPIESYGAFGFQEVLAFKPHQIQWNLMGPMRF